MYLKMSVNSKAKEIIYNASEFFMREQREGSFLSTTAEATGVSRSTVVRVRREKKETGMLLSPERSKREPYKSVDSFDQAVIRNKITEFYTVRRQLPTLKLLHSVLKTDIKFPGSLQTLRKMVREMGYRWKKTKDNRKVLIERPNIVALRLKFYRTKKEFEDRGLQFVYIDETWVDTSYTSKKCWQGDTTPGLMPPCNRGQRIIVVHAGSKNGFIPGALLIYKASSTTGDYHSQMDGKNFTKWLEDRLIPNLDEPSVIVMDNASYHSMRIDKCPTSNTRKADIQEWLRKQGIPFTAEMLRPELLELARLNKPPPQYTVDQLIQSHGHDVLRLPPYHPDFNPIELIWSQLKGIVSRRNVTFRYDDVLQVTNDAFKDIDDDRWRRACDHVDRYIDVCKKNDHVVDDHIDSLVIDLQADSSSESGCDSDDL